MAHYNLKIDETIHAVRVKCYGTLRIKGVETDMVSASSRDEESLNVIKTGDTVYVTAVKNCDIEIPSSLPLFVEKALGSLVTSGLIENFNCEKVLGSLVLDGANKVQIEKVGGNCSVRNVSETVVIEKVGGTVASEAIGSLSIEKLGGNCKLREVTGAVNIGKVGGNFSSEGLSGALEVSKVGGNLVCDGCYFGLDTKVGGNVRVKFVGQAIPTVMHVGGDAKITVDTTLTDANLILRAGDAAKLKFGDIKLKFGDINEKGKEGVLDYQLGNGGVPIEIYAGGSIKLSDELFNGSPDESFSKLFEFSGANSSEVIHQNVQKVTQMAEKKIEEAQKRLEEIGKRIESDLSDISIPSIPNIFGSSSPDQAVKKGVSNEERLLILQMLQDKKISVEEAEKLFKTLEK